MEQVLYKLPDGWEWKRIEDVFTITSGKNLTKKDMQDKGEFPVYGGNGVTGRHSEFNLDGSNIVIGRVGALCGNVRLVEEKIWITDNAFFIKEYKVDILKEYLTKILSAMNIGETANKAAQPVISYKGIKDLHIPYPPLNEQKRIVEKLDALLSRIDTAIEHLQEGVTLADALFESSQSEIFNDVLSNYQHSTIDEICIVTSSKRIFKADYVESGIPFYRTKEIVDLSKEKNISTELFIDKEKFSEICGKFGAPKKGDLLFSAVGTIGVMWIVDEREFYFKDGNLLWLKDMNGVTPEYLKSAINAVLTEKIKDRSQGAAYKAISITNLKAFEIPLPSIEEQKSIVAKIEHVSSVKKKTKQELSLQINDLQKLKASILDSAFKGEL